MNWIPVSDRLPSPADYEPSGAVIAFGEDGYSLVYSHDNWVFETITEPRPTHWCRVFPPGEEEQ